MLKQVPPTHFFSIQQKQLPQQRGWRKHLFNINNISTVQTALLEAVASQQRYRATCPASPGACPDGRGKSHHGLMMSSHQILWLWLRYSASTDDTGLCWPLDRALQGGQRRPRAQHGVCKLHFGLQRCTCHCGAFSSRSL